jgi:putative ABC transport system permease protein
LPALDFGMPTTRQRMLVVGIVKNERVRSDLRMNQDGIAYVPMAQAPIMWMKLAVRASGDPSATVPLIRERLRRIDSRVALADVRTLEALRQLSLSGLKEPAWLIGIFAMLSAFLAALGLYGVVAHAVAQQRREIGIRMALGAQANDVLSLVVRHVMVTIAAGLIIGVAGAAAVTRVMRVMLFQVSALDPAAFVIAAIAMTGVAAIAAIIPASRATRVDPTTALRSE